MTFGASEHERGREPVIATGRGGAGNIARSPSREATRARDVAETKAQATYASTQQVLHGGRGGSGNVRSPSRDPTDRLRAKEEEEKEKKLQAEALRKEATHAHSTGRGGAGNVRNNNPSNGDSESRDRSRGRAEGGVASAIRSLSRSRSREPRSSSAQRPSAPDGGNLPAVDEQPKQGFVSKIASVLPGHH